MTDSQTLLEAERRLQAAQRAGDVAALDTLLDDRLIAIGPDGSKVTKADDLAAHRSGTSVVTGLVEEDLDLLLIGDLGVTFFLGTVTGTYDGAPFDARLRYTRTWARDADLGWRVVAAHISPA
ncbi:nuclear transport factor 2 family protein [Dactylosporangium sp. McL0621]|uniref:nuclear transport factor 2 family protein n=1 Tax=Dactylosporangium sp. McL0621 TaxID=3415678 RepID=UPI003CF84AE1